MDINIRLHRWKRRISSLSAVSLIGVLVAALLASPALITSTGSPNNISFFSIPLWVWLSAPLVILIFFQTWFEYIRRSYDPTWILRFDDEFFKNLKEERSAAAKIIRANYGKLSERKPEFANIDPILDFFEYLGFYVVGDQISAEVAHHHFHYWIQRYYQACRGYIEAWQVIEPTRWEYIKQLNDLVIEIEIERCKDKGKIYISDNDMSVFLSDEADEGKEKKRTRLRAGLRARKK